MNLSRMVLSGTLLICVISLARIFLKNLIPKRTFIVLWGLAALRLMLPYSLPCALSVSALLENRIFAGDIAESVEYAERAGYAGIGSLGGGPGGLAMRENSMIAMIWVIGAGLFAVFFTVVYIRSRRIFNESLPFERDLAKSLLSGQSAERKASIRQSDRIKAPLTYGILHPVILLPKTADRRSGEELRFIIVHELIHIRHFDPLIKLLFTIVLCVHWINPAVWVMYFIVNRDIELSCDEAVIDNIGLESRRSYAGALIRMEEEKTFSLCGCSFCMNNTRERICSIMKLKKTTTASLVVSVALVAVIALFFATSANVEAASAEGYSYAEAVEVDITEASPNDADIMEVWVKSCDEYDAAEGERIDQVTYYNNYAVNYRDDAGDAATGTVSEYYVYVGDCGKAQILYIFTDANGNVSENLPDELL